MPCNEVQIVDCNGPDLFEHQTVLPLEEVRWFMSVSTGSDMLMSYPNITAP